MSRQAFVRASLCALLLFAWAQSVSAQSVSPIALRYAAPCGSEPELAAEIAARTADYLPAIADEPARNFDVVIEASASAFHGRLVVRELDGSESLREVEGERCEDVLRTLAFVAALAIDPEASAPPPQPPPVEEPAEPSREVRPSRATRVRTRAIPPSPTERPAGWDPTMRFGAQLGLATGVAPDVAMTGAFFVEVGATLLGATESSVRLGLLRTAQDVEVEGGSAELGWWLGRLDVCPAHIAIDRVAIAPCGRFELGALDATGVGVMAARSEQRLWASIGAALRLRVAIGLGFGLEVEGALGAPLIRDVFYFRPNTTIHRADAVTGHFGAGIVWSLP